MIKGDQTYTTQVELVADPRSPHSAEDRKLERATALKIYVMVDRLAYLTDAVSDLRAQAAARAQKLSEKDPLRKRLQALADSLEDLRKTMVTTREGPLTGEVQLREKILELYGAVNGYEGKPTQSQLEQAGILNRALDGDAAKFDGAKTKDVPALNATLQQKKLEPLKPLSYEDWQKKDQSK
jgi:hypothetical protein